jgi:pyruvate kinase
MDYLALSFVRDGNDVRMARALVQQAGGDQRLIAKIERHEAVSSLTDIIDATDGVMVARGDLGVEVGNAALPGLQKTIIRETRHRNRVVITATQMMESMINSPVPTRAEVSDVANAVIDGSDAVMLSAETASGKHPIKAVATMAEIIEGAETYQLAHERGRHRIEGQFTKTDEAIAMAVMYAANHMNVRAIVAMTETGSTPLWMSRIRSDIPIYAFTRHEATRRRVTLYRGVYPVSFDINTEDTSGLHGSIFAMLLSLQLVQIGDLVILTKGDLSGVTGGTNSMQILKVTNG